MDMVHFNKESVNENHWQGKKVSFFDFWREFFEEKIVIPVFKCETCENTKNAKYFL